MPAAYDAIIIGSGQAGNPLAHKLADQGWQVALIEKGHLGGTCINSGCTPTKAMIASAQVAHYARQATRWGVRSGPVSVDLAAIVARKQAIVERFRSGLEKKVAERPNVKLFRGPATFEDAQRVRVDGELLEGARIFINTGARALIPAIEGLDRSGYLTNAEILELRELPEHLLVLGGGYVGLEFGQMFRRFGSQVTVVHDGPQILPREDPEVAAELSQALSAEGLRFLLNARTSRAVRQGARIELTVDSPGGREELAGSHLLVATGRRPNSDGLGLDRAGVETDAKGFIKVNARLETSAPAVWALGDVKGGPAFTHISYNDYQIVYANLIEGKSLSTEHRHVPYSVFTDPQLGGVGLTEKEARAKGYRLKIGKIPMSWVARAIERDETAGLMKIVINAADDRILGATVLATEGGELVQMLGAVMLAGAPYTVLKGAVYTHPTLAEGFWSLMESVKPVD